MTLYEELGVPQDATPEAIRDAYRNAARLLHPDLQSDPDLKDFAETRMKRLNHIYGILSHANQRRRYNVELGRNQPRIVLPERQVHAARLVWSVAGLLCVGMVAWIATREWPGRPAEYEGQPAVAQPSSKSLQPKPRVAPVMVPPQQDLASLRGQLLAADAERRPKPEPQPREIAPLIPAPLVPTQQEVNLPPPLLPPPTPPSWNGAWVYRAAGAGHGQMFPPEFIRAVISEENGHLRGQYHARFRVAAGISPDVDFAFEGNASGNAARLPWVGDNGARGEVRLHLISATDLEITWSAADLGKTMGLDSGTSVLTRQMPSGRVVSNK